MKLREIPRYLEVKVRLSTWTAGEWIQFNGYFWNWNSGDTVHTALEKAMRDSDDWEPFPDPPKVRQVTLYQPVRKSPDWGVMIFYEDPWHTDKDFFDKGSEHDSPFYRTTIVGWCERVVEVRDDTPHPET